MAQPIGGSPSKILWRRVCDRRTFPGWSAARENVPGGHRHAATLADAAFGGMPAGIC